MSKPPFFICPPRTRSTLVCELTYEYVKSKYNLSKLKHHNELFTEFNYAILANKNPTELIPFLNNDEISMHFVYPYVFKTTQERNQYKLNLLQKAKNKGFNFHIKGTLPIADTADLIMSFFNDRKLILMKRKNTLNLICSYLFAKQIKMFAVRKESQEKYHNKIKNGITIQDFKTTTERLVQKTCKLYDKMKEYDHTVLYYEDLDKDIFKVIGKVLEDSNWHSSLNNNYQNNIVTKTNTDYSSCILNYKEVSNYAISIIEKYNFYD
jgi:hypothetical protein